MWDFRGTFHDSATLVHLRGLLLRLQVLFQSDIGRSLQIYVHKQSRSNLRVNLILLFNCTKVYYLSEIRNYFVLRKLLRFAQPSIFPTITSSVKSRAYNIVMHQNLVIVSQSHVSFPYLATLVHALTSDS